jgi:putative two-component system response regulator
VSEFGAMHLLIIGSDDPNRALVVGTLRRAGYEHVHTTDDYTAAHALCVRDAPDLVLVSTAAPDAALDALLAMQPMTAPPRSLAVIVLADDAAPGVRRQALTMGVRDIAEAQADGSELLLRVHNALRTRRLEQQLDDRDAIMSDTLRDRKHELETTRESLSVLTVIAEYHDDDTHHHAQRVGIGASLIAQALELPEGFVAMIREAAPLHDIGKVGISRRILLKPDRLTPAEWMHMMRHVEIGARVLASAQSPVLRLAGEIARTHHERWDGHGYLEGLSGEEIPISGRITAVADVWDTLTHQRPYKQAWDEERALAEIIGQSGAHFDPRVVQAFATIDWPQLNAILSSELVQLSI